MQFAEAKLTSVTYKITCTILIFALKTFLMEKKRTMKNFLLIILLIAFATTVDAQGAFSIGPKVGYNSYKLTDNLDSVKTSIKNSLQVGAFIRIGKKVYFQPEANYQVSKSTLTKSVGAFMQSQDVTLTSIKVPVLLGGKIINAKAFNLSFMVGPAVTFILDKKLNPSTLNELWPIHSVDEIKNSIWSVQMGAGIDVLFLTLDVRYEMGLDNPYNGSSNLQMKNDMFNVSLGIKLF